MEKDKRQLRIFSAWKMYDAQVPMRLAPLSWICAVATNTLPREGQLTKYESRICRMHLLPTQNSSTYASSNKEDQHELPALQ